MKLTVAGVVASNMPKDQAAQFVRLWSDGKHDEACALVADLPEQALERVKAAAIENDYVLLDEVASAMPIVHGLKAA